jgi:glucose-6-phosphate isomerase
MIRLDLSKAKPFIAGEEFKKARKKAIAALRQVMDGSGKGSEWLGWRRILARPNDAELEQIDTLAKDLRDKIDVFIVCGIGGSYLGAKALIEALTSSFKSEDGPEVFFTGHNMNGAYLKELLAYLEKSKPDGTPKTVAVNVISKSGTTLETALSFRILRKWLHNRFPEEASERIICTTGATGGALNALAEEYGYQCFVIPDDVGGRFSVLTPVGLLPAAVAGIDIRTLFYEAVAIYEELDQAAEQLLDYAAVRYILGQKGKTVDLITSFEGSFRGLGRWLQQLLGESEGKEGKGIFPVTSTYSTDLHSIGQFVQQGRQNIMETFIVVEKETETMQVENTQKNVDGLDYLEGMSFHSINKKALDGTREAHFKGGVPCISIILEEKNAQHIGEFMYFYQLFTAVYCYMIGVNPFNQPGVEAYKKEMYKLLGKK